MLMIGVGLRGQFKDLAAHQTEIRKFIGQIVRAEGGRLKAFSQICIGPTARVACQSLMLSSGLGAITANMVFVPMLPRLLKKKVLPGSRQENRLALGETQGEGVVAHQVRDESVEDNSDDGVEFNDLEYFEELTTPSGSGPVRIYQDEEQELRQRLLRRLKERRQQELLHEQQIVHGEPSPGVPQGLPVNQMHLRPHQQQHSWGDEQKDSASPDELLQQHLSGHSLRCRRRGGGSVGSSVAPAGVVAAGGGVGGSAAGLTLTARVSQLQNRPSTTRSVTEQLSYEGVTALHGCLDLGSTAEWVELLGDVLELRKHLVGWPCSSSVNWPIHSFPLFWKVRRSSPPKPLLLLLSRRLLGSIVFLRNDQLNASVVCPPTFKSVVACPWFGDPMPLPGFVLKPR